MTPLTLRVVYSKSLQTWHVTAAEIPTMHIEHPSRVMALREAVTWLARWEADALWV